MNHLEEPLPSVKELAKMFGTNDFRLKAEFKKYFNIKKASTPEPKPKSYIFFIL